MSHVVVHFIVVRVVDRDVCAREFVDFVHLGKELLAVMIVFFVDFTSKVPGVNHLMQDRLDKILPRSILQKRFRQMDDNFLAELCGRSSAIEHFKVPPELDRRQLAIEELGVEFVEQRVDIGSRIDQFPSIIRKSRCRTYGAPSFDAYHSGSTRFSIDFKSSILRNHFWRPLCKKSAKIGATEIAFYFHEIGILVFVLFR